MKYYTRVRKEYTPGQIIVSENGKCDGMYIVESGRVRVFKTLVGKSGQKREMPLGTLGPKAMFGEMAMLDERPRSASVRAMESTVCTIITRDMFIDQMEKMPPWMYNIIKVLVTRIRKANDSLRETVGRYARLSDDDTGGLITVKAEQAALTSWAEDGKNDLADEGAQEDGSSADSPPPSASDREQIVQSLFRGNR